jgi:hypothetical protein
LSPMTCSGWGAVLEMLGFLPVLIFGLWLISLTFHLHSSIALGYFKILVSTLRCGKL